MTEGLSVQLVRAWYATSWIEIIAVVLAVAYLLLAIRQSISCWVAAFVSSCLYVWVLFGARLYMESVLNGFYAAMAVYGFWQWRGRLSGERLNVTRWSPGRNALAFGLVVALSLVSSYFLRCTVATHLLMEHFRQTGLLFGWITTKEGQKNRNCLRHTWRKFSRKLA